MSDVPAWIVEIENLARGLPVLLVEDIGQPVLRQGRR
jgi:hypothetical protein